MTQQPSRHRSKWSLDFTTKSGRSNQDLPPPVGYSSKHAELHVEAARSVDPNLKLKRTWDVALGPMKQLPMNLFLMYMSGNTISIFPIMMVFMMAVRPVKTLFTVNATFKTLDSSDSESSTTSNIGYKIIFILGNLANLILAMYKCHSMGLLPTYASDWLAFADPIERMEWAYVAS